METSGHSSSARKLAILSKIGRSRVTAPMLVDALAAEGIMASLRTVQRDLQELAPLYSLVSDNKKPKGWSCDSSSTLLDKMDLTTAITFLMVEKYLVPMLPNSMRSIIAVYVERAKKLLVEQNLRNRRLWHQKIVLMPEGGILRSSETNSAQELETLYQSLLHEKCVRLTYCSFKHPEKKRYYIHPYGIVIRKGRSYLLGCFEGHEDIRTLLIQRITDCHATQLDANIPSDFDLQQFIDDEGMDVHIDTLRTPITLRLWVDSTLKQLLEETPISDEQTFEVSEGDFILTANVNDTADLRFWLMSVCDRATVLEPPILRNYMKSTLAIAAQYYTD